MSAIDIRVGDVLTELALLPVNSVQCCVTSPPYWGLRDYGVTGQMGLEPTPALFIEGMVRVFRLVRNALRRDGILFLNIGDSYVNAKGGDCCSGFNSRYNGRGEEMKSLKQDATRGNFPAKFDRRSGTKLSRKNLLGMPWRLAFALQDDGWILRSDIIWSKPNPMPESVKDRPTKSHEYVFMLTKSERYFFDADAVRTPLAEKTFTTFGIDRKVVADPTGMIKAHRMSSTMTKRVPRLEPDGTISGANIRTVWSIAPEQFDGAHFAVMPQELASLCIEMGSSAAGACGRCGSPLRRVVEKGAPAAEWQRASGGDANGEYHGRSRDGVLEAGAQNPASVKASILAGMRERVTVGWRSTCKCEVAAVPCLVLDPFAGAGTTGLVALGLRRRFVGIELNPAYARMARRRIQNEVGILAHSIK